MQTVTKTIAETDRCALRALAASIAPAIVNCIDWDSTLSDFETAFQMALDNHEGGVELAIKLKELEGFAEERARRSLASVVGTHDRALQEFDAIDDPVAAAIFVHLDHPELYERALVAADADNQIYRRSWGGYRLAKKTNAEPQAELSIVEADKLAGAIRDLIPEADASAKCIAKWFERRPRDVRTSRRRRLLQATIYSKLRAETGKRFDGDKDVVREARRPVVDATILYDVGSQEIDVIVRGGKPVQDSVVAAFIDAAFADQLEVARIDRRRINLEPLRRPETLPLELEDEICKVTLVSVTLASPTGDGFMVMLKRPARGAAAEVWSGARRYLKSENFLEQSEWTMLHAELKLTRKPAKSGGRERSFPVRLSAPNRNNLHDLKLPDADAARPLLERWGILEHREDGHGEPPAASV